MTRRCWLVLPRRCVPLFARVSSRSLLAPCPRPRRPQGVLATALDIIGMTCWRLTAGLALMACRGFCMHVRTHAHFLCTPRDACSLVLARATTHQQPHPLRCTCCTTCMPVPQEVGKHQAALASLLLVCSALCACCVMRRRAAEGVLYRCRQAWGGSCPAPSGARASL